MSKEKQDHSAQFHHRRPSMPLAPQCPLRVTLSFIIYYTVIGSETTGHTRSGSLTCMLTVPGGHKHEERIWGVRGIYACGAGMCCASE